MEYLSEYICDYCETSHLYAEIGTIKVKEMHPEMKTTVSFFCSVRCIRGYYE